MPNADGDKSSLERGAEPPQRRGEAGCVYLAFAVGGLVMLLSTLGTSSALAQAADETTFHEVTREELYAAMLQEKRKGYSLEATSNGGRFEANIILQLVRWAQARDPEKRPLLISHAHYYWAFLELMGLEPHEAPASVQMSYDRGLDQHIEYRRERIIKIIDEGLSPKLVVSVKSWWPEAPGTPANYTYLDTLARPHILVINERVTSYRLLDMQGMIVFDEVTGVKGRPTTGVLGLIFKLIGPGRVVGSRLAFSRDGLQVVYGIAKKGFITKSVTATVYPDGRVEEGIPPERPDLKTLEAALKKPLKITYKPIDF